MSRNLTKKVGPFSRTEAQQAIKFINGIQSRLDKLSRSRNIPAIDAFCLSQESGNVGLITRFIEEQLNEPQ